MAIPTRDCSAIQPELIAPTERLHAAWLQGHAEWGAGLHEDEFG